MFKPQLRQIIFLGSTLFLSGLCVAQPHYDLVIKNGHIIDGTGSPWYSGDLAIRNGRIVDIGNFKQIKADRIIDAHGMVVAPGFIDMLGQSEQTILVDPRLPSKIYQGITTEITGEGESVAPLNDEIIKAFQANFDHLGIKPDWRTFSQYFARLKKQGMGINLGTYIGAATVREMVIGYDNRQPSAAELKRMQALVAEGMKQGAMGLSTALMYAPAPYASTEELIALAQTASQYGGIYATHMRNEGEAEMSALDETFRIGKEAHIPVEIFHLKVAGKANWGKAAQVIERIEAARLQGIDVAADTYAYTAWGNPLSAFIPPWAFDGGVEKLIAHLKNPEDRKRIRREMETPSKDWDNEWQSISGAQDILIGSVNNKDLVQFQGKRISDVALVWHEDPIDTIFDFLIKDNAGTNVMVFAMNQADTDLILQQPWVSINNDAAGTSPEGILGADLSHPRGYGTFPRILKKYVHDEHKLTLPDAIRKFTSLAAQRENLADRGVLKQGMWADIVVFDPEIIHDLATFDNPNQLSVGMQYVLVNGVPVISQGKMTGALPGRVLYGPGFSGKKEQE